MIKIQELIKDSILGIIGYTNKEHLEILPNYIEHNKWLYSQFENVIIYYTSDDIRNFNKAQNIWKSKLNNCLVYFTEPNLGHTFGTMTLDTQVVENCQGYNKKYIWKSTVDVIFFPKLLEIEIQESDFYYINQIGYGGMNKYNFSYQKMIDEDFYPSTNFYIINSKVDYINNEEEVKKAYKQFHRPNTNSKLQAWEIIGSSEDLLKRCITRNNFTKQHLLDNISYKKLLELIYCYQIHDCSYKNILPKQLGVCHFHFPNKEIIEI